MENKKSPENLTRERLYGLRTAMLLRFGEKGTKLIFGIFAAVIIAVILFIAATLFVRIRSIEITGDVTMFNESEIIAAAEINEGDGLFWRSSGSIRRNIEKNMPIAQNVKVKKSIFGKVTIEVHLIDVDYYCRYGDMYYAFDESLNVLAENKSASKYSAYGAVYVKLPEIRQPAVGKKIVFYDTVEETDTNGELLYEVKDTEVYAYVSEFLTALKSSGYHGEANGVLLEQKFSITLFYADTFKVRFGDARSLDVKFGAFYSILAEGSMQYYDKVSVDLTDPSKPTARPDLALDFSDYLE